MNPLSDIRRYPFRFAFTLTAVAVLFLSAGGSGYVMGRHEQFVLGTSWVGHVIWWEVAVGASFAAAALFQWRKALKAFASGRG